MGLFGKIAKKAKDGSLMNGLQAAQALSRGDYAGAAQINAQGAQLRLKQREAAAEAEQLKQLHATIDNDPALPTPQAKAYAKANPKAYIDAYMTRFQSRQFGPEGGSVMTPGTNGPSWATAPRFDSDGNIYAPGNGLSVPSILQRGTKTVPVQPGGTVQVHDSITGRQVAVDGSIIGGTGPTGAPPRVLSDEDIRRLDQGGAGPAAAPRTFPFRY